MLWYLMIINLFDLIFKVTSIYNSEKHLSTIGLLNQWPDFDQKWSTYSKTCVKMATKNRQKNGLNGMKVKSSAECSH